MSLHAANIIAAIQVLDTSLFHQADNTLPVQAKLLLGLLHPFFFKLTTVDYAA